jgi:hypothetical protein
MFVHRETFSVGLKGAHLPRKLSQDLESGASCRTIRIIGCRKARQQFTLAIRPELFEDIAACERSYNPLASPAKPLLSVGHSCAAVVDLRG